VYLPCYWSSTVTTQAGEILSTTPKQLFQPFYQNCHRLLLAALFKQKAYLLHIEDRYRKKHIFLLKHVFFHNMLQGDVLLFLFIATK